MASNMRLLSGRLQRVAVCYNGGFKAVSAMLRGFSTQDAGRGDPTVIFEARREQPEYPESELYAKSYDDKFGEQFRNFPFPGNVTTAQHYLTVKEKSAISTPKVASALEQSDVLHTTTAQDRQLGTLQTFSEASRKLPPADVKASVSMPPSLECAAQPCPELARKHFAGLFPNRDIQKGTLTVMTLAQRTENDMSEWSDEVDKERDEMMSQFMSTASAICDVLQREGHWADFIDPSSGRPYLGPFTNATLFETDERYRHFGFAVDDLGCCKVIRHPIWGTHAFVGAIFCDAPMDAPVVQKLLPQGNAIESASVIQTGSEEILCQQPLSNDAVAEQQPISGVPGKPEKPVEVRALKHDDKC